MANLQKESYFVYFMQRSGAKVYFTSFPAYSCPQVFERVVCGRRKGYDMLDNRMRGEAFRTSGFSDPDRLVEKVEILRVSPPNDAEYLYELGLELSHSGKFDFAIDLLNRALVLRPQFPVALYQKGVCQDHLDNRDDALKSYDACLTHDPYHAEAWFNRGMLLKKMGRHDEGDRSVKKAVDLCCGI